MTKLTLRIRDNGEKASRMLSLVARMNVNLEGSLELAVVAGGRRAQFALAVTAMDAADRRGMPPAAGSIRTRTAAKPYRLSNTSIIIPVCSAG